MYGTCQSGAKAPRQQAMAETELSVVCKSCGSEVSPYVTECPYCGTRLRKRAPKLERRGDGLEAQESRRDRRRRERRERKERKERTRGLSLTAERPYVTIGLILAPAALLVVARAAVIPLTDLGLVVGTPGFANPWWHYQRKMRAPRSAKIAGPRPTSPRIVRRAESGCSGALATKPPKASA